MRTSYNYRFLFSGIIVFFVFFLFQPAGLTAQDNVDLTKIDYVFLAPLPIGDDFSEEDSASPVTYIPGIVRLVIGIAGALAVIQIIIGGFKYISSEGFGQTSKAKETIQNALLGLLLIIGSFGILYTINPKLVTLDFRLEVFPAGPPIDTDLGEIPTSPTAGCKTFRTSSESRQEMIGVPIQYWNESGKPVQGRVTVQKCISEVTSAVFADLYTNSNRFPIRSVGGQNWRNIAGSNALSAHSQGLAIDINSSTNGHYKPSYDPSDPSKNLITPGWEYRPCPGTRCYPTSLPANGSVVSIFKKHGFGWGGNWNSSKDFMHFSCQGGGEGGNCPANSTPGGGGGR